MRKRNTDRYRRKVLHFIYFYKKRFNRAIDAKLDGNDLEFHKWKKMAHESLSAAMHQLYSHERYGYHDKLVKWHRKLRK